MELPTPIGLLREQGPIGQILRQLPRSVLDEAEKQDDSWSWLSVWVTKNPVVHWHEGTVEMRDAECVALKREGFERTDTGVYLAAQVTHPDSKIYQGVREVRFDSDGHDPNKIIMRVVMKDCWPDSFRQTFVAAASQRKALLRLTEIARGGGSISQSWLLKMKAAQTSGDQNATGHWANKVMTSILQWEKGRRWLLHDSVEGLSAPPELREVAERIYDADYNADVRRLGRKKADEKWKSPDNLRAPLGFKRDTNGEKITAVLALGWLSVGSDGFPGFCFISDRILATVLGLMLPLRSLLPAKSDPENQRGRKTIEDCRRDVGLEKGETLVTGLKNVEAGKWAMLDEKNKEVWIFKQG